MSSGTGSPATVIVRNGPDLVAAVTEAGVSRGDLLALTLGSARTLGLATSTTSIAAEFDDVAEAIRLIDERIRPRWLWWSNDTARALDASGVRVSTCMDLAAVHRLVFGGWRVDPQRIWAKLHDLPTGTIPVMGQLDLLGGTGDEGTDFEDPIRPDGHIRPEWASGGWATTAERMARWASLALEAAALQNTRLGAIRVGGDARATSRSESAAELLCVELENDGLPLDVAVAERIIEGFVGPRPRSPDDVTAARRLRDDAVLRHAIASDDIDLRNPTNVRSLLRRVGLDVSDTRAWRLEQYRDQHPLVDALLNWRKAERIDTTFGYSWLDTHVGPDGRLRGAWTGCDGAAGRMTAQAGLHNMPADLRPAVVAEPGHLFVRADLGQIEPRVLAAVSGDAALAKATQDNDLYAPVAKRLGVERAVAKVAVLAAMYGQTSGAAGQALRGLESAYPVAMQYLRDSDEAGRHGRELRTYGGRLLRMYDIPPSLTDTAAADERAAEAGRGRYARNAVVQGAAAELFKAWAVTVRARATALDTKIVLCLHDELLVHAPAEAAADTARLLDDCLQEAAARWSGRAPVRFVADISVIELWSDAKG